MDSIKYLHFEISTSKEGDYKVPFLQLISAMNLSQESEIESLKLAVLPTIMCTAAGLGKLAKLKEAIALVSFFSFFCGPTSVIRVYAIRTKKQHTKIT